MQIAWYCCHTLHFTPLFSLSVQYHEKARYLVVTKLSSCLYSLSHPQFSFIKAVEGMYVVLTRITRKYWYTVHIVCVWARIRRRLILNAELAKLSTRHVIFSMMVFAPVSLSLILAVYIRLVFFCCFHLTWLQSMLACESDKQEKWIKVSHFVLVISIDNTYKLIYIVENTHNKDRESHLSSNQWQLNKLFQRHYPYHDSLFNITTALRAGKRKQVLTNSCWKQTILQICYVSLILNG